jgi:hypothetical protein
METFTSTYLSLFRTEISTQNDLLSYCPAPGDLLYPEMFLMMKNIESQQPKSPDATNEFKEQTTLNPIDQHGLWYPVSYGKVVFETF